VERGVWVHQTFSHRLVSADRYIASASRSSPSAYAAGTAGGVPSSTAEAKSAHSPSYERRYPPASPIFVPFQSDPSKSFTQPEPSTVHSPFVPVTVNSGWFAIAPVASIASNAATTPDSKRINARHSDSPSMSGLGRPSAAIVSSASPSHTRSGRN